jgi:rfaE bifunctional protein nucleotidyltransferase chain/domain
MPPADKILSGTPLELRIAELRRTGGTLALANGLFDILHVGHLRYLEASSREADLLLVAINSDRSARELKGPSRPIVPERERAELIAGFGCVDLVTVFSGATVEQILRSCRPDVHCKGTDYTADTVPEAAITSELGIRVAIVGDPKQHSSREMITRLRNGH